MLAYIALPNLATLLSIQCYPRYSEHKNLVRLNNRIRHMDLYDYYRYHKDRANMILYLRDGFDRCVLTTEHVEMCCYNGLLFEALPTVITKEYARYITDILLDIGSESTQYGILLAIMWIYADTPTKEIIHKDLGGFFPLLSIHGRTLTEQLKLYNSEQICKLEWTLHDIYSVDWGINYELVNILAKNLTNGHKVLQGFIQLLSNNIPINPNYIHTPQAYEILLVCGYYSADQIIKLYNKSHCNNKGIYSHKFTALILCSANKHKITDTQLQDFILDDCEYCKRILV